MTPRTIILSLLLGLVGAGTPAALGDTVYMLDGSVREGIVETHNDVELHLRVARDGIAGTLVIPMAQISRAVINRHAAAASPSTPPPTSTTSTTSTIGASPSFVSLAPPKIPDFALDASNAELNIYRSHGFLLELATAFAGHGLDDLNRLPLSVRIFWERATRADISGRRVEALEALRSLESTMHALPEGIDRLDAISHKQRDEGFGVWMGRVHWELISNKYANGQFDLADVRDIERPALIGYLKESTGPVLEPLKPYFPSVDEKTGQYGAFRASQLQGISSSNALDVKAKATLAAAVLLAQINLEPGMPAVDKGLLYNQLIIVNRIRSRASELETAAKAALARAEQEKRAADEKARREANIQASKARLSPK